jgi:hypothetical protein
MEKQHSHPAMSTHHDPASFVGRGSGPAIQEAPFAGRIGGNLEFTASDEETVKRQPDAVCFGVSPTQRCTP